ncbi:3'-5' exonuclease [Shinella zoogloeoides]|uniref:3'-5' exonuclease n=1 Tax=Shinella zoogloeoides TaxID=352475 RepID=UPI00273ECC8F|nr:3'-5' exonuclease [Shinella zoogloeoides]WLR90909.1 3'-5' exonuclease [Shinella zoogloeoides]
MTIIAGLDTETTGIEVGDHRLIEIYIGLWKADGTKIFAFEQRIDPERSIAVDAQRVHGISSADLIGKPTWATVAPAVEKVLSKATHFVAHNAAFDMGFLKYELERVKLKLPERPVIDTMAEGIWACPDGKKPTLQELCFAMNEEYDPALAHAAAYDVDVMMRSFFKALKQGWFSLPGVPGQAMMAA